MKLIPDWRRVLSRAWSLRLIELAALADIILNLVPAVADYLPWWLTLLLLGGAYVGRMLAQPEPAKADKEAENANQ
ncbi:MULTISPECIES: hypothetical protein [Rhizobium]|uniref:Uncharacterized protein n=2 Tax=Rhizobium favelukesii TaxID=348824 RepID=W6R7C8_9HYPH|nr:MULTISPECIES: hypothetical protein [Rhizobium]MCS0462935.1 hypothetical protein [Rhizobium favelukesii]UFS82027.1 hypothetical protein LPB79_27720 [Rhizobium sp. T136]CDM56300.1 hypothetical protein LPU83_0618 [Rhizobium favelukesii]